MSPTVVLVGLPGAGKSTTGRRLAKILGLPFADSDELVEAAQGATVAELFARDGEAAFRTAEAQAIAAALAGFDGVLALGGGALTDPRTSAAVAAAGVPVALLEAPLPVLVERIGDAASRPLLTGSPEARLRQLADERRPLYEAVATLTVDTTDRTPAQAAAHIAARLHEIGALA